MCNRRIVLIVACVLFSWSAVAQEGSCDGINSGAKPLCEQAARLASVDQPVPQSPGFAVLGVSPETIVRPGTTTDIAVSLLNAVDANGNFQSGIALDFSPFMAIAGDTVTLQDYQDSWVNRLLVNTQLSIATSKGQSAEDETSRLGIGLRFSPWIKNDPRRDQDTLNCVGKALLETFDLPPPKPDATDEDKAAHQARLSNPLPQGTCEFTKDSGGLNIGIAGAWRSADSSFSSLSSSNSTIWASLGVPFGTKAVPGLDDLGQFILHLQQNNNELVMLESMPGEMVEQDSLTVAGRLRFRGFKNAQRIQGLRFEVEAAYVEVEPEGNPKNDFYRYLGELYFKVPALSEVVWLKFSLGRTNGAAEGDETYGGLSFQWGINNRKT